MQSALALAQSLYGDARLASGESALDHALGTAAIVSELKLDGEALAAALLAPVTRLHPDRMRLVAERCGAVVAELVEGVARMEQIHALSSRGSSAPAADGAGQMLQAGAARRHRRLRHAGPRRYHPPRRLCQPDAARVQAPGRRYRPVAAPAHADPPRARRCARRPALTRRAQ